ncbi:MAG: PTS fructose transporter subunit IIA [Pseudomonadota bacterium]
MGQLDQINGKGKIGIVIVAHGGLAKEYLAAVEHVVGHQDGIVAVGASSECNRSDKEEEICMAADAVDAGHGVVVVTDLFGGSPSNLSRKACRGSGRKFLYGANLPMLIKLAKCRSMDIDTAVSKALDAGRKYIDIYREATAARV